MSYSSIETFHRKGSVPIEDLVRDSDILHGQDGRFGEIERMWFTVSTYYYIRVRSDIHLRYGPNSPTLTRRPINSTSARFNR